MSRDFGLGEEPRAPQHPRLCMTADENPAVRPGAMEVLREPVGTRAELTFIEAFVSVALAAMRRQDRSLH